jgi:branched-chain amino acid transport system ATP-binding protein
MLEIKGLSKSFGGIVVADRIDLVMRPGRILGLIGPNGAGKTSLFNLVSGLYAQNAGTVTLDGGALDGLALHERARRGLARTWQHVRLFPSLSVIDNLLIGARQYPAESLVTLMFRPGKIRSAAKAARAKALDILARIGLPDTADKSVGDLPYGQQKLVGVARALMNDVSCSMSRWPASKAKPMRQCKRSFARSPNRASPSASWNTTSPLSATSVTRRCSCFKAEFWRGAALPS